VQKVYVRHSTTSLFAAFNTADGSEISSMHRRHRAIDVLYFPCMPLPMGPAQATADHERM
jgi:hypothetical protein